LAAFLKAVKEADMFAIYRPGPFICAEWEMGGFPAWLLRDPHMHLRSNYKPYMEAAGKYYEKVLSIVNDFQFSVNGGPIIALQLENEYGGVRNQNICLSLRTLLRNMALKNYYSHQMVVQL
jgi:beta-galactosidase